MARPVVVCGGAMVDTVARPFDQSSSGASQTSLPGEAKVTWGGVGRNVAEILALLGGSPKLLSAVGEDGAGGALLEACRVLGIDVNAVVRKEGARTGSYTALLDGTGELVGAVVDAAVFDEIVPSVIQDGMKSCPDIGLLICDANLSTPALEQVSAWSAARSVPAWFEPVSVAKAAKGRLHNPWHLVSPNVDELRALLLDQRPRTGRSDSPASVVPLLEDAHRARLAEHILLTMGPQGVVLTTRAGTSESRTRKYELDVAAIISGMEGAPAEIPMLVINVEPLVGAGGNHIGHWYRLMLPLRNVRDVTGAGDALLAGAASAFMAGWALEDAVVAGMLCAHVTLFVQGAIPKFLDARLLDRLAAATWGVSRL